MVYVAWDRLRSWSGGPIRKLQPKPSWPWVGMDTETCRGDIKLLADSDGDFLVEPTLLECLRFLYRPYNRVAWWNIRYDIECVLRKLPTENLEEMVADGKTWLHFEEGAWELFWLPKKLFTLRPNGEPASRHYDAMQFYNASLDGAARQHLGDDSKYLAGLDKDDISLLGSDPEYWHTDGILNDVYQYCLNDCRLARDLMRQWEQWANELSLDFSGPISPASLSAQYAIKMGHPARPPPGILTKAAYEAYIGGWFETRIKGRLPEVWSPDINSAYPSIMRDLPSTDCVWQRYDPADIDAPYWGFARCDINVTRKDWSPILRRVGGKVRAAYGEVKDKWLTLWEVREYAKDFDIKVHEVLGAEDNGERPFAWVADIYEERLQRKAIGDPTELVLKIIINSLYGKWMQKVLAGWRHLQPEEPRLSSNAEWKVGQLFNPVLGAHTTAGTRIQIWRDIVRDTPTALIATDGVLTTEQPKGLKLSKRLGEWDLKMKGGCEAIIIGNGQYWLKGIGGKARGIDGSRDGIDWPNILAKDLDATNILFDSVRPIHPAEALKRTDWSQDDIGDFIEMPKRIDFSRDKGRYFGRVSARDLLTRAIVGTPLELSK